MKNRSDKGISYERHKQGEEVGQVNKGEEKRGNLVFSLKERGKSVGLEERRRSYGHRISGT